MRYQVLEEDPARASGQGIQHRGRRRHDRRRAVGDPRVSWVKKWNDKKIGVFAVCLNVST